MIDENKIPECELGSTLEKIQDNRKVHSKFGLDSLKVRPCEVYYDEYKDCQTLKTKFRDLYIGGFRSDCQEWYNNYIDCYKFRDSKELEPFGKIVESEKKRIKTRTEESGKNNVWTYREEPPKDFSLNPILPKQSDKYSPFEVYENIKEKRKQHLKDAKNRLHDFVL